MEPEVRHGRHDDQIDAQVECQHGQGLVAVDDLPPLVHGQHPVAIAIECDPQVEPLFLDRALQQREIRRAAADVDVVAVRLGPDRRHPGTQLLERLRCDARDRLL